VPSPTQNTIGEIRTEANIILKVVDQCIKAGLLEEAKGHLDKARIIDPTNAYIYAFEERISFLKEETIKRNAAVNNRVAMEEAVRAKLNAERQRAEEERLKREADNARRIEENRLKKSDSASQAVSSPVQQTETVARSQVPNPTANVETSIKAPVVPKQIPEPRPQQKVDAPIVKKAEPLSPRPVPPHPAQDTTVIHTLGQGRDMYKRVLLLAWADGAVSPEEQVQLQDLKNTLRITPEEHANLEAEAKEESYTHALSLVLSTGMNTKERSAVTSELRQKYQISQELHVKIEAKLIGDIGTPQGRQILYVIDDDENVLTMLVKILEAGGYAVQAYSTSDEALVGLKNDAPDLIISDINLETSTIGGFSFYEKVRQLHHLSHVPFIFLSGMTDEGMVRYGKSLGVDDYLTKPFSGEMLLDTIKGKLKRYKQMKHN
jgi:CheY-like chemotaxis protein